MEYEINLRDNVYEVHRYVEFDELCSVLENKNITSDQMRKAMGGE